MLMLTVYNVNYVNVNMLMLNLILI